MNRLERCNTIKIHIYWPTIIIQIQMFLKHLCLLKSFFNWFPHVTFVVRSRPPSLTNICNVSFAIIFRTKVIAQYINSRLKLGLVEKEVPRRLEKVSYKGKGVLRIQIKIRNMFFFLFQLQWPNLSCLTCVASWTVSVFGYLLE